MMCSLSATKKVLITGVAGFIGRALARHFARQQYTVYGIDRISPENAPLADLQSYEQSDLPNSHLSRLFADWQPDVLIHCAGRASVPAAMLEPHTDYIDGPFLTFEILETLRKNLPGCAFIFLSSAAVYGNPLHLPVSESEPLRPVSAYGYHKWQSEILCAEFANVFGMKTASARIFSAYGPGLRRQVMWDIVHKALTQSEVRLQGTGRESRDFIHAQDIAHGLETILVNAPLHGEVYNLASGIETSIVDLAGLILSHIKDPPPLVFSGELPPGTPRNWKADVQQISELGFRSQVALDDGVSSFVSWCRNELQGV